ncbi:hypothetical protein GCM10009536_60090 [Streptomyces thermocarboxydus]
MGAGGTSSAPSRATPPTATGVPGTVQRRVRPGGGRSRSSPRPYGRYRISKPAASATSSGGTATNPSSAPDANSR